MPDVSETTDDALSELLTSLQKLLGATSIIEGALVALEGKRVTLEEKMIKAYLHQIIVCASELVRDIHQRLADDTFDIAVAPLTVLSDLAQEMESVFKELAKMIDYNLNYLEQYYEHEFYARLVNEHKFVDRLKDLKKG